MAGSMRMIWTGYHLGEDGKPDFDKCLFYPIHIDAGIASKSGPKQFAANLSLAMEECLKELEKTAVNEPGCPPLWDGWIWHLEFQVPDEEA